MIQMESNEGHMKEYNYYPDEEEEKLNIIVGFFKSIGRYFDELSYEEIAVELEAPLGTVKAQLHRARELMYDLVKGKEQHI